MELFHVPQVDQSIRTSCRQISTHSQGTRVVRILGPYSRCHQSTTKFSLPSSGIKLQTIAVGGVGFHGMDFVHRWVLEHFDVSLSSGEEEQVALGVPAYFVHLHSELCLLRDLKCPCIDNADHIFLKVERKGIVFFGPQKIQHVYVNVHPLPSLIYSQIRAHLKTLLCFQRQCSDHRDSS